MKDSRVLGKLGLTFLLIMCTFLSRATAGPKIYIIIADKTVQIGDPLIVQLNVEFEQPVLLHDTNEVAPNWVHDALFEIVKADEDSNSTIVRRIFPSSLMLQDDQGILFGLAFPIFYDHAEKKVFFDEPGTYRVRVLESVGTSNQIEIKVKEASPLVKKALTLLSDPNDYFFIEFASHEFKNKRPYRILHLQEVVKQCEGTILAKWAAARLGLEYFEDFHKKHPSFVKFKDKLKKGQVQEPLFDKAHMYLTLGAKLTDEFPIREKVLYQLGRTEVIKDNYEKAFSLLDELGAKYPKGEYGKRASKGKEELQRIKKREEGQSP